MTFVFLFLNFEYHISSKKEKKKNLKCQVFSFQLTMKQN